VAVVRLIPARPAALRTALYQLSTGVAPNAAAAGLEGKFWKSLAANAVLPNAGEGGPCHIHPPNGIQPGFVTAYQAIS
jgi:hypothetical protein